MYTKDNLKQLFKALGVKINFGWNEINEDCFEMVLTDREDLCISKSVYIWKGQIVTKNTFYNNLQEWNNKE